jgi:citrate lyase subunit beta/citryl-CoA lyase
VRSLLFIPADDERKRAKGPATGADALILDLEDAVCEARKGVARALAASFIGDIKRREHRPIVYVRINALDTPHWQDDLAGVMASRPDGILLPKARSGEDVHTLSVALDHAEERAGATKGETRIVALTSEVSASLLALPSFVGASTRLAGLTWGAEDLSVALGARGNREADGRTWRSVYRLARDLCLVTAAAADVQAIDTVFVNFSDAEGLAREAREAADDGFTAKMAIHPSQVAAINQAFTPSPDQVALAEKTIAAFAANPDAGALSLDGAMIDKVHLKRAERILARARAAKLSSRPERE